MSATIAERFASDTAGHQMIVKRDDGLYRHLRFVHHRLCNDTVMRPGHSFYWFDVITWPGTLTVNGDCGTFVFSRITDMFEFFRSRYGINPQYWSEKLQAPDPQCAKKYSQDAFRQHVVDYVTEAIRYGDAPRGIGKAVRDEIFGPDAKWSTEYEEGAREALRDFEYGDTYTAACHCGDSAEGLLYGAALDWRSDHRKQRGIGHFAELTKIESFRFTDTWEWDLTDYDWQFLWCCHAIQWGIAQYDASKAVSA
jgi:hypothetical protein